MDSIRKIGKSYFQGVKNDYYESYLGIRYANPPVGNLRFAPPEPYGYEDYKWYDSTNYGAACLQNDSSIYGVIPYFNFDIKNKSEDCLFLNVYTPNNKPTNLPVMVFIYGGSFVYGSASQNQYLAGDMMNSSNVIVVTFNYRLGPFGFLSLSNYGLDDANFGIMDQIMALQWVQKNIASFGGDPTRVTIYGESAGAISVCLHLMIEESYSLYKNAIVESGSCAQIGFFPSVKKATKQTEDLTKALSCTTLSCLRSLDPLEILNALPNFSFDTFKGYNWLPIVDKTLLVDQPRNLLKNRNFNRNANLIIGNNMKDGSIFVPSWTMDVTKYTEMMYELFGAYANEIGPEYPIWDSPSPECPNTFSQIMTDMFFYCPSRFLSESVSNYSQVYMYIFDHVPSWLTNPNYGVYHSSELPFVFQRTPNTEVSFSPEETLLAGRVSSYWKNFAIASNPNSNQTFVWPQWTTSNKQNIQISTSKDTVVNNFRDSYCVFWDALIDEICLQLPCRCDGDC